ncbi:hypothetical protein Tco_0483348 [Tanacetum coccineum]
MPPDLIPLATHFGVLQIGIKSQGVKEPDTNYARFLSTQQLQTHQHLRTIYTWGHQESRYPDFLRDIITKIIVPGPDGQSMAPTLHTTIYEPIDSEYRLPPEKFYKPEDLEGGLSNRTPRRRHRGYSISEEVAERVLALPTPPPSPLSPYSSPLPQIPSPPLPIPPPSPISPTYVEGSLGSRAAGIRQRDALPVHETEIPEMWLPLRKRLCRTTPLSPRCEVGIVRPAGASYSASLDLLQARQTLLDLTDML